MIGNKAVNRQNNLASNDRQTLRREFLPYTASAVGDFVKETRQMSHRSAGNVVQHHQGVGLSRYLCQCQVQPTVGIRPIAGNGIP